MSKKTQVIFLIVLLLATQSKADIFSTIGDAFNEMGEQISTAITNFFTSDTMQMVGEMFGIVPTDYVYSYVIWNDSNVPIYSSQQNMTAFLGGTFANALGMTNVQTINPASSAASGVTLTKTLADYSTIPAISTWKDTAGTLTVTNEQMLFNLYISDKNPSSNDITSNPLYLDSIQTLSEKASTKVYHYRAYNARAWSDGVEIHTPRVELLGYSQEIASDDTTSATPSVTVSEILNSMIFLNNTADDVNVDFTYNSSSLTIRLEAYSFNCITLIDETMSLRPNTFYFYDSNASRSLAFKTLPFAEVGIANTSYTVEIYQNPGDLKKSVGLQGLSMGNYDTALSGRVRDVTPISCTFWWQSVAQYAESAGLSSDDTANLLDLPGQIWMVYNSVDSPIMAKVTAGNSISCNLLRPTLAKGKDYLYFVYVQTSDDAIAQKFISEFVYGSIGDDVISAYKNAATGTSSIVIPQLVTNLSETSSTSTLNIDQELAVIAGTLDYTLGSMKDSSGTVGYLLGGDYFASFGIGSGAQYYVLSPSIYDIDSLVNNFSMYMTAPSDLKSTLHSWVTNYVQSPEATATLIKNLLIENGSSRYVSNGALTNAGIDVVETLLTGPTSIENPSIYMTAVQNQYIYSLTSSAPTGMPIPSMQASVSIPDYVSA
jgi:hypothetical protein